MKTHYTHIILLFIKESKQDFARAIQLLAQIVATNGASEESKLYMSLEILKRNQIGVKVLRKKPKDQEFQITDYNGSLLNELGHFDFNIDLVTLNVEPNFLMGTLLIKVPYKTI